MAASTFKTATAIALLAALAQPVAAGSSKAEVDEALVKAEAALAQARETGNSWTSTEKLMAASREALAAGNGDDALELANRALLTAEQARAQPERDKDAWQARVPAN